jgi:hypothetical protein
LLILATALPIPAGDSFCKDKKNFWHTHKQKQQQKQQHQPEHIYIAAADDVRDVPERPKKMHATAAAEPTNRDNKNK